MGQIPLGEPGPQSAVPYQGSRIHVLMLSEPIIDEKGVSPGGLGVTGLDSREGPFAPMALPARVPHGFHGNWLPTASS